MKLSATAVATVILFASGISAKKDRSLGSCKSSEEGLQKCSTYTPHHSRSSSHC
jgi:hypothetical protein